MIKRLRYVWFSSPDDSFLFTSHHQTCQNEAQMLIFCLFFLWNLFVCWLVWRFSSFCLKVRSQRPCDVRVVWSCYVQKPSGEKWILRFKTQNFSVAIGGSGHVTGPLLEVRVSCSIQLCCVLLRLFGV